MGEALFQVGMGFPGRCLQFLGHGDVGKGDDQAADAVVLRTVGHDAYREPAFVTGGDLFLGEHERPQHFLTVLHQSRIFQSRGDVGYGTTNVTWD